MPGEELATFALFELLRHVQNEVVEDQKIAGKAASIPPYQGTTYTNQELCEKIDKLALCCQAMWELIQQQTNLNESDLNRKVMEIDMRDGVNDQHMAKQAKKCPRCDSMISVKFQRCLFCGYVDEETSPLKSI